MALIYWRGEDETSHEQVDEGHPLPVQVGNTVEVAGKAIRKFGPIMLNVTDDGSTAYSATDAFGAQFVIENVPKSGIIQGIRLFDGDDDTMTLTVHLFSADFTATADNSAYAVSDDDFLKLEASIIIDTFRDAVVSKVGVEDNLGVPYVAPSGKLWGQCQLQTGTPTIAIGATEALVLYIIPDAE